MTVVYLQRSTPEVVEIRLQEFDDDGTARRLLHHTWDPDTGYLDATWEYQRYAGVRVQVRATERITEISRGVHQVDELSVEHTTGGSL